VKHTALCYESIASKYAATVDTKPHNALYERPAMISLFPPLKGLRVLDAGCGSGGYAEYLADNGAQVTALDFNTEFVALTKKRLGNRATVFQADLTNPLSFAQNASYDLVIAPMVLHYICDWSPVLAEFNRILKGNGLLIFSTHHPFMDWQLFKTEDYFATDFINDEWSIGKVSYFRRPLTAICESIRSGGFVIETILEPRPVAAFRKSDPENYEKLMKNPWFILFRAKKAT
jgi:SAM-dependent methyltransferase